ncbi:MAG: transposase [Syntrophorhabdales bacterium]
MCRRMPFSDTALGEKTRLAFSLCPIPNARGFAEFPKVLDSHHRDLGPVVLELKSTFPCHLNLYSFLISKGITTIVVNPLIIANFNRLSLRRTKTDKKGALTAAAYLFLNRDVPGTLPSSRATTDLQDLAGERGPLSKMAASMKNDLRRILQTTFPELEQLVDVLSTTMLCFTITRPRPKDIVKRIAGTFDLPNDDESYIRGDAELLRKLVKAFGVRLNNDMRQKSLPKYYRADWTRIVRPKRQSSCG